MPEVRLIDANAFAAQYGDYYAEEGPEDGFIGTVGDLIAKQPTIEAEPVRRGRWENGKCMNCKHYLLELVRGDDYDLYRYAECDAVFCPFCGARMDGGADNG